MSKQPAVSGSDLNWSSILSGTEPLFPSWSRFCVAVLRATCASRPLLVVSVGSPLPLRTHLERTWHTRTKKPSGVVALPCDGQKTIRRRTFNRAPCSPEGTERMQHIQINIRIQHEKLAHLHQNPLRAVPRSPQWTMTHRHSHASESQASRAGRKTSGNADCARWLSAVICVTFSRLFLQHIGTTATLSGECAQICCENVGCSSWRCPPLHLASPRSAVPRHHCSYFLCALPLTTVARVPGEAVKCLSRALIILQNWPFAGHGDSSSRIDVDILSEATRSAACSHSEAAFVRRARHAVVRT